MFQIQAGQSEIPVNPGPEPTPINMGMPNLGSPKGIVINFASPKARKEMPVNPALINLPKRGTSNGILEFAEPKLCQSIYTINSIDLPSEAKPPSPKKSDKQLEESLNYNDIQPENLASMDMSFRDLNDNKTPGKGSQGNLSSSNLVFTNVVSSNLKKRDGSDALG